MSKGMYRLEPRTPAHREFAGRGGSRSGVRRARPGSVLPVTWEGETVDAARQRAEATKTLLEETAGARVVRTAVGAPQPLRAIGDELLGHPGYDVLVICTLPPGIFRWLKLDLVHRAERKFGLRVVPVATL